MKKALLFILIVMAVSFAACGDKSQGQDPQTSQPIGAQTDGAQSLQNKASESPQASEKTAVLIADFSNGNSDLILKRYDLGYSGELTPEKLLEGLTNLTGLDFYANVTRTQMGILVDWKKDSTLIANLDDREQKEEFHFFDADSLRWFMMDSLYRTLIGNFGEEDVYYSMDGEKELKFDELSPSNLFPIKIPYQGSPFYYAHVDGRGFIYNEDEASVFLNEQLTEAGYDLSKTALIANEDGGDPYFGDMEVWYFDWGQNTSEKFTAEKRFAVTFDWKIWEYDAQKDEWTEFA